MPDNTVALQQQIADQTEDLPGDWTKMGWVAPNSLSFEDWSDVGLKLSGVLGAIHWWLGDWITYGENRWGEKYAQALDATDFEYNTIAKDAWVARSIPYDQRRPELSYSHHRNFASSDINDTERAALLNLAVQHKWTSKKCLQMKMEWIRRRNLLLVESQEDGKQLEPPLPLPSIPELPPNPTTEDVLEHIKEMEQERRVFDTENITQPRKRRGTGFPQIYDPNTGELMGSWRGIWPNLCDNCRDNFLDTERAAWEDDYAESRGQDSSA